MKLLEFLVGDAGADGQWHVRLGRKLHGAFGGANGGVVAAAALLAARGLAPGRRPAALDARFVRGLVAGTALVVPELLHTGRTLTCVSVDVRDERERLCTRATISLLAPEALEPFDAPGAAGAAPSFPAHEQGRAWPRPEPPVEIPLLETFDPRSLAGDERGIATSLQLPFEIGEHSAEAACIAADVSVGPPVGRALSGRPPIPHPNPDLSLRFGADAASARRLVGVGRLEQISSGLAQTRIEVWDPAASRAALVAIGISSSTQLAGAWPDATRSAAR